MCVRAHRRKDFMPSGCIGWSFARGMAAVEAGCQVGQPLQDELVRKFSQDSSQVIFGIMGDALTASIAISAAALLWPELVLRRNHIATTTCCPLLRSIGILDTAQNAVYLDVAPNNAAAFVSLGNAIARALEGLANKTCEANGCQKPVIHSPVAQQATLPGAAGPALVAFLLQATGRWPLIWGIIAACLVVSQMPYRAAVSFQSLVLPRIPA